jgi:hypothetical protein
VPSASVIVLVTGGSDAGICGGAGARARGAAHGGRPAPGRC